MNFIASAFPLLRRLLSLSFCNKKTVSLFAIMYLSQLILSLLYLTYYFSLISLSLSPLKVCQSFPSQLFVTISLSLFIPLTFFLSPHLMHSLLLTYSLPLPFFFFSTVFLLTLKAVNILTNLSAFL